MNFHEESNLKSTSIGEIPKDWKEVTLEDVTLSHKQGFYTNESYSEKGVRLVRITDLLNPEISYETMPFLSVDDKTYEQFKVTVGDFLFARSGAIGRHGVVTKDVPCIFASYIIRFRFDRERVNNYFLSQLFQAAFVEKQFLSKKHGATNINININAENIKSIKIPLPPIGEQKAIVGVLGVVDSAIELADKVIAKTERLKKGLMQQLLTRGIGHTEYKDTPIGTIPKTWQIAKLEEVSKEVIIGNVNPATPFYTTAENGVPYFRSQNVRENNLLPTNIYVKKEFNQIHPKSILKENDVLTIQTGFIGTSCLVPKTDEGSNCHSLLITRTNPQLLNPQFLCHFLNSDAGKKIIMKHNAGWGRNHLLLEYFRKADIPIPPLAEQNRIVNILSTIYQKAALERNEKLRLERIKVGLMDLLLTGKVRIKVD